MKAVNILTTPTVVAVAGNRDFLMMKNNSDEVMFLKFDGSAATLTTANGFPLAKNGSIVLNNTSHRNVFNKPVEAIHGGAGTKDMRVQGED